MSISNDSDEKSPKEFSTALTRESNNPPIKPRSGRKATDPCPLGPFPTMFQQFSTDSTLKKDDRVNTNSSTQTVRPIYSYR